MDVSRRSVLAGAGFVTGGLLARPAGACSVVPRLRPIGFSDAACRRSLQRLIALIHAAATSSADDIARRASALSIAFDSTVIDPIMNYPRVHPIEDADLIRAWGMSDGKPDRSPVALREINLLKSGKGVALYQFTLRRDAFHAGETEDEAAGSSCGMGAVVPYYGPEDASYLGLFLNNALREVSAFDAWLREL